MKELLQKHIDFTIQSSPKGVAQRTGKQGIYKKYTRLRLETGEKPLMKKIKKFKLKFLFLLFYILMLLFWIWGSFLTQNIISFFTGKIWQERDFLQIS